jgi:hypothetical protein
MALIVLLARSVRRRVSRRCGGRPPFRAGSPYGIAKGFRIYWRLRSHHSGLSKTSAEIRDLIRRMSATTPLSGGPHSQNTELKLRSCLTMIGEKYSFRRKIPRKRSCPDR